MRRVGRRGGFRRDGRGAVAVVTVLVIGVVFAMTARSLGLLSAMAPTISTRSVAANGNTASFALGSTLASFDGGIANAILSGLTGSQIALSALDYQNLAAANVDLFGLARALAVRIGAGDVSLSALAGC